MWKFDFFNYANSVTVSSDVHLVVLLCSGLTCDNSQGLGHVNKVQRQIYSSCCVVPSVPWSCGFFLFLGVILS